MTRCNVAIVDANKLFREGLQQLLKKSRFSVVVDAPTAADLLKDAFSADLVSLLILSASSVEELETQIDEFRARRSDFPELRLILLTDVADPLSLLDLGLDEVDALLSRNISSQVLQRCLELVELGQKIFPPWSVPAVSDRAGNPTKSRPEPLRTNPDADTVSSESGDGLDSSASGEFPKLVFSEREDQVLRRLASGLSNKTLARELQITESTVKVHVKGLLRKIQAANRTQAAIWAVNNSFTVADRPALYANGRTQLAVDCSRDNEPG